MEARTTFSSEPEYASVEDFVDYLLDDERTVFTLSEVAKVASATGWTNRAVIDELKSYGLTYREPQFGRRVRGFQSCDNDRFFGPGAEKMHGGSGWEQVNGFAGQTG